MPLRPELYRRLQQYFGRVRIANEGEAMQALVQREALSGKKRLYVQSPGEYYCVACPHCGDTRQRLWINHLWGYRHPETKDRNLWLCHCYNDGCLNSYGRQKVLYDEVFSDFDHESRDIVLPGTKLPAGPVQAAWPGSMRRINELDHNHPARRYLEEDRHYNVDKLAEVYDVRYCLEPDDKYRSTFKRIIIPITMNGALQGWQARFVGTPPCKETPKYLSMPGMKRNQLLYNFDNARKSNFVVIMEGPTDVWSFGPEAVALFGKSASTAQLDLIARHWQKVYVCLDGDAANDGQGIYDVLGTRVKEKHMVALPANLDPGDLPPDELRSRVLCC